MSKINLVAAIMGMVITSAYSAEESDPQVITEYVEPRPSASSAKLMEKFSDGNYWSVGSDGPDLLTKEPGNNELRLAVADSLAWTERYAAAISQYQFLAGTALSDKAALGLANVYLWSGRPDLARPLYQSLNSMPGDPEIMGQAADGLVKAERQLRPTTDVNRIIKSDSNTVEQQGYEISQHWRGDNPAVGYELSLHKSYYTMTTPVVSTPQKDINFGVENPGMAMAPKLDLSAQQEPLSKAFGSLRLKPVGPADLHITMGHVNWGNMEFEPQGLIAGLSANQVGVDGSMITHPGKISALYNNYQVSDGNRVWEEDIKFFPSWNPVDPDFKYYVGLEGRRATVNVPTYWSPAGGYQSGNIGFSYEWSRSNGEYSINGGRGFHVAGEAEVSYNMGVEAKRYFNRDWAASLSAGILRNQRIGAYRAKYLTFGVERLW